MVPVSPSEREATALKLVKRFQAGQDEAASFEGLFNLYYGWVRRFLSRRGPSEPDRSDLVQETFLRLYRALPTFRGDSSFDTWLLRIAMNVERGYRRSQTTLKRSGKPQSLPEIGELSDEGEDRESGIHLAADDPDPLAATLSNEQRALLRKAVEELPPQQRRSLILRLYYDLSYEEIAALLLISVSTVKSHLNQARMKITELLRREGLLAKGDDDE